MRMRLETGMLRVTYGPKMRQTSHKTCFEGLYLPNLSNKGFVGLTARNTKKYINDFSLNSVKVLNLDPRFYTERLDPFKDSKNEGEGTAEGQETPQEQEAEGEHFYTDEMEGHDLLHEHEEEQEELEWFIEDYQGNIRDGEPMSETLYKMNEHMNHILLPLNNFISNEDMMQHYVRDHSDLPRVIQTFEELPKAIEDEAQFVQTIDYQLQKIKEMYSETVRKAFDVQQA